MSHLWDWVFCRRKQHSWSLSFHRALTRSITQACNLSLKISPVTFHNFTGFDGHLLIQAFAADKIFRKEERRVFQAGIHWTSKFSKCASWGACKRSQARRLLRVEESLSRRDSSIFWHAKAFFRLNIWTHLIEWVTHSSLRNKLPSHLWHKNTSVIKTLGILKGFGRRTWIREYHGFYLRTDVLLLCDIIRPFRSISVRPY